MHEETMTTSTFPFIPSNAQIASCASDNFCSLELPAGPAEVDALEVDRPGLLPFISSTPLRAMRDLTACLAGFRDRSANSPSELEFAKMTRAASEVHMIGRCPTSLLIWAAAVSKLAGGASPYQLGLLPSPAQLRPQYRTSPFAA